MPAASGLASGARLRARERAAQAAVLGYHHAAEIGYTQQTAPRWEGITLRLNSRRGEFPKQADCSSFVTWCLFNALELAFNLGDLVNGQGWTGGYTGTMRDHGLRVQHAANLLRGDCVHYGGGTGAHVTIVVAKRDGVPMVVSHGSQSGPHFTRYDYRDDVDHFRRYI
jgi:hypothetical protein